MNDEFPDQISKQDILMLKFTPDTFELARTLIKLVTGMGYEVDVLNSIGSINVEMHIKKKHGIP